MGLTFEQYVKRLLDGAIYSPNRGEGSYTVTAPALPGCVSCGKTVEQARDNIKDAIEGWILLALRFGDELPRVGGKRLNALQGRPSRDKA